ncbi:MAG: hypothetical protein AABY22_16400 [Nanoarchaeota archaeon]
MKTPKTESIFDKEMPKQPDAFICLCRKFEIALRKISNIRNNCISGTWDEIDKARKIARNTLYRDA